MSRAAECYGGPWDGRVMEEDGTFIPLPEDPDDGPVVGHYELASDGTRYSWMQRGRRP